MQQTQEDSTICNTDRGIMEERSTSNQTVGTIGTDREESKLTKGSEYKYGSEIMDEIIIKKVEDFIFPIYKVQILAKNGQFCG